MYQICSYVIAFFLFFASSVEARMYKCTMPDGSVKYSGTLCSNNEATAERLDRKSYKDIENSSKFNYEIHELCSKKHPYDDYMREACVNIQASSLTHLIRIYDMYPDGSIPHRAIANCIDRWKDAERLINYQKALRCTKNIIK